MIVSSSTQRHLLRRLHPQPFDYQQSPQRQYAGQHRSRTGACRQQEQWQQMARSDSAAPKPTALRPADDPMQGQVSIRSWRRGQQLGEKRNQTENQRTCKNQPGKATPPNPGDNVKEQPHSAAGKQGMSE